MAQPVSGVVPRATSSKRSERMLAVLTALNERGVMSLSSLATELRVSAATVRRDLADLEDQGLLLRTHGGARAHEAREELPVRLRDSRFRLAKQRIAQKVAGMLPPGPFAVALSGGTTTAEVAKALVNRSQLTIVTNSLTTAVEIASRPNLKVIMTGGVVRSNSFEAVGSLAEGAFNVINVGMAILGTDGISARGGATTHDETEARTNHAMVTHAQRVVVVADGSKVGRITLAQMAEPGQIDVLVTDSSADADELRELERVGIELHVVDVD